VFVVSQFIIPVFMPTIVRTELLFPDGCEAVDSKVLVTLFAITPAFLVCNYHSGGDYITRI
jgi:hypothetical protein